MAELASAQAAELEVDRALNLRCDTNVALEGSDFAPVAVLREK
jgi:hypothetical protein